MSFLDSLPDRAQIFDVFASRPDVYEPFVKMVEQVSRGDSPFTKGQRELIGAHVSALNQCQMCVDIHASAAKAHGVVDSDVDDELRSILTFVTKLTESPHTIVEADAEAVFAAGWDERALHDAVLITCIASFMNRFVFGLGIESEDAYREAAGRAVEQAGYLSRFKERLKGDDDAAK